MSARVVKIISIICFGLIIAILVIAHNTPATGYEASIYTATPPIVWVVLIASILSGVIIVFHQVYTRRLEASRLWSIGLLLVAFSFIVLLSVHIMRDYLFFGGDEAHHIAWIRGVLASGRAPDIIYPATHVLVAELSQITNIQPPTLLPYMSIFFNILFIIFMYVFARSILPNKSQVIVATVAGIFLLSPMGGGHLFFTPGDIAWSVTPLVFFLGIKCTSRDEPFRMQYTILFLIMIFLLPVFHIVPSFAFLLMLITLWLPFSLYNLATRNKRTGGSFRFTPLALLLFIWIFTWISSFGSWNRAIRSVYITLTEGGATQLTTIESKIAYATQYGYSVVEQFFKVYYDVLVYVLLTLISFLFLLKKSPQGNVEKLFSLYGPLAAFALFTGIFFMLNIGVGPTRIITYGLMICALFVGFVSYEIMERARSASAKGFLLKVCLSLTAIVLLMVPVNGILKAYPSSYLLWPNWQITSGVVKGIDWFFHRKDADIPTLWGSMQPYRFRVFLLSQEEQRIREDIPAWTSYPVLPYHFNYDKQTMLGESYTEDNYMVIGKKDRVLYTEVWPQIAEFRFYPSDFERLEHDPSIDKLYCNGGLDIWYIIPWSEAP